MDQAVLDHCQKIVEYTFGDLALLERALTHSSVASNRLESNERMEFLGDAVLGIVIVEKLYRDYEDFLEGEMTQIKSAVVSRRTCAEVSDALGITDMLVLGKGIDAHQLPSSLAAAVLESIIGAIYLDGGMEAAREFVTTHMSAKIIAVIEKEHAQNYKSILQQYAQRKWSTPLQYELLDEKGPDHAKAFEVGATINGRRFDSAWGATKKEAEQLAAQLALRELGVLKPSPKVDDAR